MFSPEILWSPLFDCIQRSEIKGVTAIKAFGYLMNPIEWIMMKKIKDIKHNIRTQDAYHCYQNTKQELLIHDSWYSDQFEKMAKMRGFRSLYPQLVFSVFMFTKTNKKFINECLKLN